MKPSSIKVSHIGVNKGKTLTPPLIWNDDAEWDERPRNIEEQVQMRRARKSLADCELPEGFRLVTPMPKQFWMGNQLIWGFKLGWAQVKNGQRGRDEFTHVTRYWPVVSDEVQMRWALEDFSRELFDTEAQVKTRGYQEARLPVYLSMRVA